MEWIIKPNRWYDKVEEPYRMLIMLGLCAIPQLINMAVNGRTEVGLIIFAIIGLYRITFHIIMDSRKLTQAEQSSVS